MTLKELTETGTFVTFSDLELMSWNKFKRSQCLVVFLPAEHLKVRKGLSVMDNKKTFPKPHNFCLSSNSKTAGNF